MKLARSCAFVPSVLFAFALTASAAQAAPQSRRGPTYQRMNQPLRSASLDLATGTVTRGPTASNRGGSTVAPFENLDLSGFTGMDSGGGVSKWFCAGLKGSGSNQSSTSSDLMESIVFAYCTTAKDTNSGGPGGSVTLGFYEGYTLFGGAPTTAVAVVALTGLPGSSAPGSRTCVFLTVHFGALIAFRDSGVGTHQGIGYSWTFEDVQTNSPFAATFPFFACIASCSGTVGVMDGQGMTDAIDRYSPAGSAVPLTFSFGTTNPLWSPQTWTSVNMQIQQVADRLSSSSSYNATLTPNADTLTASAAIVGQVWSATITRAVPTNAANFTVLITTRRSLPNGTTPHAPVTGRTLVQGPQLTTITGRHNGTTGTVVGAIPLELGFCGIHYAAQATVLGGGVKLSSAVAGTTGTF